MNGFFLVCAMLGYNVSYDGMSDQNLLFQVTTPDINYGIVLRLDKPSVYCDMILYKNQ